MLAVTATIKLAVAVSPEASVTDNVTALSPSVAAQVEPEAPTRQFLIHLVEHDIGQEWRQRATLRRSFPDDDARAVRHHDHSFQHQAHNSDHPAIRHLRAHAVEKALVLDPIKELSEIEINDRLATGFEMLLGFGDGRRRTALRPEPVTAGVDL